MNETIELPFWPSSLHALQWSEDDQLACAGGDQIAILTPPTEHNASSEANGRNVVIFKISDHKQDQLGIWPVILSWENFSVGEELSSESVGCLAWSHQGLGTDKRCVLAVLTTDHVLSLWDLSGKLHSEKGWQKSLVINDAIRMHYEAQKATEIRSADEDGFGAPQEEMKQVRQRIVAFCWTEPLNESYHGLGSSISQDNWGQHLLVLSTEAGDILILRVLSTTDQTPLNNLVWSAVVVHRVPCIVHSQPRDDVDDPLIRPESIATSIASSRWRRTGDISRSQMAYLINRQLFILELTYEHGSAVSDDALTVCSPVAFSPRNLTFDGPLTFSSDGDHLLAVSCDHVYWIDVFLEKSITKNTTTSTVEDHWDRVAGITATGTTVSVGFHLSTVTSNNVSFDFASLENPSTIQPTWQQAIRSQKHRYASSQSITGSVTERVYGMASSPLGDCIATCFNLLPSDGIIYVIQSDQRCLVNITRSDNDTHTLVRGRPSSQSLLFWARRWQMSSRVNQDDDSVTLQNALLDLVPCVEISTDTIDSEHRCSTEILATADLMMWLRTQFTYHPDLRSARIANLSHMAMGMDVPVEDVVLSVTRAIALIVLALLRSRPGITALSNAVLYNFKALQTMLADESQDVSMQTGESCPICQEIIDLESIRWARCKHGHQFSRCALSTLLIKRPGICKRCSLCKLPYLNQVGLADYAPDQAIDAREPVYLLLHAVDTCVYCGGKFTT